KEKVDRDNLLITWLIVDQQPFTVVDNIYFVNWIRKLDPRYTLPTRQATKQMIIDEFNYRRERIHLDLAKIPGKVSLTADMWTDINKEAFLGLTIHYLDDNWKLCGFLLDIIPFKVRHTGINMAQAITNILEEFNLHNKCVALTTDNASSMIACSRILASEIEKEFNNLSFSHYRCATHVLNLAAKQGLELVSSSIEKVRNLMLKIKHSTLLCTELEGLCEIKKIKYLKPEIDIDIRWNSTHDMLKKYEKMEVALLLLSTTCPAIKELLPNDDDKKQIQDTLLLLEPLKVTTEYLSSASYPTLADVRFYFNEIQMNLDFYIGQNNFTQSEIAASIFQKIDEYSSLMDATSVISTILDPRTKLNAFHNNEIQDAKQQVLRLMDHYQNESFESFTAILAKPSTNNSKKTREYFRGLRNQAYAQPSFLQNKSPTQKNHTELEIYLAEPVDEENDDPVLYWKTMSECFQWLAILYQKQEIEYTRKLPEHP
ncbi:24479_t:CDS:2, partial [Cetraspora pellucida]